MTVISALMGTSSARSTRRPSSTVRPCPTPDSSGVCAPSPQADSPSVTVTVKVEPTPFSLSTEMLPFISSTMLLVMGMPRPVLP